MTPRTCLWHAPEWTPAEPADSWVRRVASLYGVTPTEMIEHLGDPSGEKLPDDGHFLAQMALASERRNQTSTLPGPYCPVCFMRDLHRGTLPIFRKAWQRPWATHCQVDGAPLFLWPYRDSAGRLLYPEWVSRAYFTKKARALEEQADAAFRSQLVYARRLLHHMLIGADEAFPWQQQIEQEQVLLDPADAPCRSLLGMQPGAVRRVVNDLSVLLGHNFGRTGRCQAADLAGFLGPSWLFASSFASGRTLPGHSTLCLASFVDPAQRRSLLTLSTRMLTSFAADPEFTQSGAMVDVGETMLSRELKSFPEPARRWAQARAKHWPNFVVVGVRGAMRCDSDSWR